MIASAGLPEASGIGSGQTVGDGSVTLCRMTLTAAERAARFEAYAISDQGEERRIGGLGLMKQPAEESDGWRLESPTLPGCSLALSGGATLDFTVAGISGTSNWIGHLTATFTDNYSG
jgi:hypothetical protein